MNKSELISAMQAEVPGASKKVVAEMIDAFVSVVGKTLAKGEPIALIGFGTFKTGKREARDGINPLTKQPLKIAACVTAKFVPGATLKAAVNAK